MSWPPALAELKSDMKRDDDSEDSRLQTVLDAATAFVQRVHRGRYDFDGTALTLPDPPDDLVLGTLRLSARYHARRKSVEGLVDLGELGASRVPSFDPDIDRLLRIGRYARPVFA